MVVVEPTTSLADWLRWLNIPDCDCPYEWKAYGQLYGVSMGHGWVRMKTSLDCMHHCSGYTRRPPSADRPGPG